MKDECCVFDSCFHIHQTLLILLNLRPIKNKFVIVCEFVHHKFSWTIKKQNHCWSQVHSVVPLRMTKTSQWCYSTFPCYRLDQCSKILPFWLYLHKKSHIRIVCSLTQCKYTGWKYLSNVYKMKTTQIH